MQENNENISADRIEGRNPVWEALKAKRPMEKLIVSNSAEKSTISRIEALARRSGVRIEYAPKEKLDKLSGTGRHQGVIAVVSARAYDDFSDTLDEICSSGKDAFIVLLDEMADPHNLGAIIRSAECAGAQMVAFTQRRSAGLTQSAERASAGALEHIKICRIGNLARAVEEVKERGIWVAAADMDGENLWQADLCGPLALVIGGEGEGVHRLVREKCDRIVSIPLMGKTSSLNASVAAGVMLYEALRQRAKTK